MSTRWRPWVADCPSCGEAVERTDNFCGHCGHRLADHEATRVLDDGAGDAPPSDEAPGATQQLAPVPGRGGDAHAVDGMATAAAGSNALQPSARDLPAPEEDEAADDADTGEIPVVADGGGSTALFPARPAADDGAREPVSDHAPADDADAGDRPVGDATEVVASAGGVDLAICPACEAMNAVQRSRCARCGAALHGRADTDEDDYELQELPSQATATEVAAPAAPQRRRSRRTGLVVVALGIVIGGLIGTAFALGLGPFDRGDRLAVEFDAEDYTSQPGELSATSVESSQVRPEQDGRSFGPTHLVDEDATTAWIAEDADDARLVFHFDVPVWITSVEVANGDQHDAEAFDATARVRTLMVDMGHGSMLRATLLDGQGRQVVRPRTPVLTDEIALDVAAVTEGDGVGVSELEFVGHRANDEDAAAFRDAA